MKNLSDQVKNLFDLKLYSNVVRVCSLAITIFDQKPEIITLQAKCQMFLYYADSLYQMYHFAKAENFYMQVLQLRKNIIKNKSITKLNDCVKDIVSDVEIKYKIYKCFIKLKQFQKAINVLQSVPARSRTPKINMALGNLYRDSGMERSAIACYKEVLRESPLALEAAESLLGLGVNGTEVNSLMLEGTSDVITTAWINQWLRGQAEMQARDFRTAMTTFQAMDTPGLLKDNVTLLVMIAQCYHFHGDRHKALNILQRVLFLDPNATTGMDILAALLSKEDKLDELEKLIPVDMEMDHYHAEHWVALAYYMYSTKKYGKAAYFAHKACVLSPRNVEALILKGSIFLDLKKFRDAAVHLRQAMQISPYIYESHEYLVLCYVNMDRIREALTVANNACKQLGQTPRALTLYASVLLRDPVTVPKGKSLLEKAVKMDQDSSGTFIPAVFLLVDCYEQEMALESAAALLKKHAEQKPTSRLHQMLADVYSRLSNNEKAFEHYNIALNLNPKNRQALEGLHSLGRGSGNSKLESSYYLTGSSSQNTVDGGPGSSAPLSDHEGDPESDSEPWPHIELQRQNASV